MTKKKVHERPDVVVRVPRLGPCHEWTGAVFPYGYGKRMYQRKVWLAHRAAWDEQVGPIPPGLYVLHKCDNPRCYRVDHLFLGSAKDNSDDMIRKGRARLNKGERNGRAKFTKAQIRAIRSRYTGTKRGNPNFVSQKQLAEEYGTDQASISRILRGEVWKEI